MAAKFNISDKIFLSVGLIVLCLLFFGPHFTINYTASIPKGLYLISEESPSTGDYTILQDPAILRFAHGRGYIAEHTYIGKQIIAGAGDNVIVSSDGIFVNGQLLPNSQPLYLDSQGRVMPVFRDTLILSEHVFLYGNNANSFDSRYFGPVSKNMIQYTLEPILTIN